ncbi:MAG: hypothetical protein UX75_C0037G0018 [Candidatus Moranbacteria bacterium GW2011_GWE2_47_10]|nr:MAG: hypothetical protein UX75_C0037G0018 [Candidatus Moranbacteria bacterium GW2011_GWE2_47_10]
MNKQLVKMCDELLADWMTGTDDKANKAWARILKDLKNK